MVLGAVALVALPGTPATAAEPSGPDVGGDGVADTALGGPELVEWLLHEVLVIPGEGDWP
jgi:hypothetical protein